MVSWRTSRSFCFHTGFKRKSFWMWFLTSLHNQKACGTLRCVISLLSMSSFKRNPCQSYSLIMISCDWITFCTYPNSYVRSFTLQHFLGPPQVFYL
jgi:hypothetical protein